MTIEKATASILELTPDLNPANIIEYKSDILSILTKLFDDAFAKGQESESNSQYDVGWSEGYDEGYDDGLSFMKDKENLGL